VAVATAPGWSQDRPRVPHRPCSPPGIGQGRPGPRHRPRTPPYRRAAEEFTVATGWTLHRLRHSALTHLAEDGVDVALLKAKSRHRSLRSLERYVRPSEASVAKLTADHDPLRRRRP